MTAKPPRSTKPNSRNKEPSKAPAVRKPKPLGPGDVEVSGIWGRVRYNEEDPFAEVKEIFDHYDRDHDGRIAARDLDRICGALGMEMEEHELKVALLDVDRDADGKVAWEEFKTWWQSMQR